MAQETRELLTISQAAARVCATDKQIRRRIAQGLLPTIRPAGQKAHLIDVRDLDRLYAPTTRAMATGARPPRESETARIERQLAAAGIATKH